MKLKLYNGEFHNRGNLWYILFASFFVFMISFSIILYNTLGAIFLFIILGGYLIVGVLIISQQIEVEMLSNGLKIDEKIYARNDIEGFVLEMDMTNVDENTTNGEVIRNIVFLIGGKTYVHTINDTLENKNKFIIELGEKIPLLNDYQKTFFDKLSKALKL